MAFTFLVVYIYLFLISLGADTKLIGLSAAAVSILEIPFFLSTGTLLRKTAPQKLILFSFIVLIIRLVLTARLVNPVWGVALNLINGIFFPLYWTGSVNYARQLSPLGMQASGQAFFAASFLGVGGITGAVLGGWLYTNFGAPFMFYVGAGFALSGMVAFLILGRRVNNWGNKPAI